MTAEPDACVCGGDTFGLVPEETRGCTVATVRCKRLLSQVYRVHIPSGMAWAVPEGPAALMAFYGEGQVHDATSKLDLYEDDLLLWTVCHGTELEATGDEGLLAYMWDASSVCSDCPPLSGAAPSQIPQLASSSPPVARSLLVADGADVVISSQASGTRLVSSGEVIHPQSSRDFTLRPRDLRGNSAPSLLGFWEVSALGSIKFGAVNPTKG